MWWFNAFMCLIFIEISVSYTIKDHMTALHDTIVAELNCTKPTNFDKIVLNLKEFNDYTEKLVLSFSNEELKQFKEESETILQAIKVPQWVFYDDFSALKVKYHLDDKMMQQLSTLIKKTAPLWDRFDRLCLN